MKENVLSPRERFPPWCGSIRKKKARDGERKMAGREKSGKSRSDDTSLAKGGLVGGGGESPAFFYRFPSRRNAFSYIRAKKLVSP